jgi:hypothetical protein
MADAPRGRFYVEIIPERIDEARRLGIQATAAGRRAEFVRWVKEVQYRLAHEADEWGESREPVTGGRVEYRVGVAGELTVWYSLDVGRAVVYVQRFRLRGDPDAGE